MKNLVKEKIETERLLLVPTSLKYKEDIFREFNKSITKYMYPKPAQRVEEVAQWINSSIEGLKEGSNFQMVALKKESEEFLGCAALHHVDRKAPEMGVWLKKPAHGNGYGKEAMAALKKWADKNLGYEYILYPVADKNIASRKIPESLGGKIVKEYDKVGLDGNKYHCLEYRIYSKQNLCKKIIDQKSE